MSLRTAVKRMYSTIKEVPAKRYEYIYGVSPHTANFRKFRQDQDFFSRVEDSGDRRPYDAIGKYINFVYAGIGFLFTVPFTVTNKVTKKLSS